MRVLHHPADMGAPAIAGGIPMCVTADLVTQEMSAKEVSAQLFNVKFTLNMCFPYMHAILNLITLQLVFLLVFSVDLDVNFKCVAFT